MIFNSLQKKTWPPVAYERGGPTPKALGGLGFRCKLLNLLPITINSTQLHYLKKVSVMKN